MREFSISSFKANALSIVRAVTETKEKVLVTKRGKPLAFVVPYEEKEEQKPVAGQLADTVLYIGDIETPFGPDIWEAARDVEGEKG